VTAVRCVLAVIVGVAGTGDMGSSLNTRDTVFALTPATRATPPMVVIKDPPGWVPAPAIAGACPADPGDAARDGSAVVLRQRESCSTRDQWSNTLHTVTIRFARTV
jgi:hypothetical protein